MACQLTTDLVQTNHLVGRRAELERARLVLVDAESGAVGDAELGLARRQVLVHCIPPAVARTHRPGEPRVSAWAVLEAAEAGRRRCLGVTPVVAMVRVFGVGVVGGVESAALGVEEG